MKSVEKRQETEQRESATGTAADPWREALSRVLSWSRKAEAIMTEKKRQLDTDIRSKISVILKALLSFL